jgi:hypothetical protein
MCYYCFFFTEYSDLIVQYLSIVSSGEAVYNYFLSFPFPSGTSIFFSRTLRTSAVFVLRS